MLELNVRRTTFGEPLSDPNRIEKTKAALRALMNGVLSDARVGFVLLYSPWILDNAPFRRDYLISLDDPETPDIPDDPTPSCAVLLEYTFGSSPPGGPD